MQLVKKGHEHKSKKKEEVVPAQEEYPSKIEYTTPQKKFISFNGQQIKAIVDIKRWLQDPNELIYTLSGYAGTGKTTLVNYIIKDFSKVAVSAPTHKAKIIISKATDKKGETIQKLLGLKPNTDLDDFDVNNPQFDPLGTKYISHYKLVVIDEASMLNKGLFTMLVDESKKAKTKLLFMGDEAQLPPIDEFKSQVFSVKNISQLTKVERQSSDNPLMKIYDSIRDNIQSKNDVFKRETHVQDNKGIIFYDDEQAFKTKVIEAFKSPEFQNNENYAKVIAYTNSTVKYWNTIIREELIGKNKRIVEPGDLLMSYSNILISQSEQIYNSADYKVLSVCETFNKHEIDIYQVTLEDIDSLEQFVIDFIVPTPHNIEKFKRTGNALLDKAKSSFGKARSAAWAIYYAFKGKHCIMSDVGPITKDFDYGYAITVHKSQGSTYTNVFVDEGDIDTNKKYTERNKLKYVSFSRPTDVVHCLNITIPAKRRATEAERLMIELWNKASNFEDTKEAILAIGSYLEHQKLL